MKTSSSDKPRVPQPPLKPIIGNLGELDSKAPIQSMMRLAGIYGPILKLTLLGRDVYVVSSQELVNEHWDELAPQLAAEPLSPVEQDEADDDE